MMFKRFMAACAVALAVAVTVTTVSAEDKPSPLLGQMNTFEADLFLESLSLDKPLEPREVATYVNRAIQDSDQLKFASPADGVIHMECMGINCYAIKASVTVGPDGPVVWQTVQATGKAGLPCYKRTIFPCARKDERSVGEEIIEKLVRARQKVLTTPSTVNYTPPEASTETDGQ